MNISKILQVCFFLFTTHIMYAQSANLESSWLAIEQMEVDGKLKSLLPEVKKLHQQAVKEKNSPYIVRAVLYMAKILLITEDQDASIKAISLIEEEMDKMQGSDKALVQSYLAQFYTDYYIVNLHKIRQRTTVTDAEEKDFRNWTQNEFWEHINQLYATSISNPQSLISLPTSSWRFLTNGVNYPALYPTAYDLLVDRYIKSGILSNDALYPRNFQLAKIESLKIDQKQLYERWLTSLTQRKEVSAFLYQEEKYFNYLISNKFETFQSLIPQAEFLSDKYRDNEWVTEIDHFLAVGYYANNNKELAEKKYKDNKKALEYCDKAIRSFPESVGSMRCLNLKNQIEQKEVSIQVESYVVPGDNIPFTANHKNAEKLYIKIMRPTDVKMLEKINANIPLDSTSILEEVRTEEFNLKPFNDYLSHSFMHYLSPLPAGTYVIKVSYNQDFTDLAQNTYNQTLKVSQILTSNMDSEMRPSSASQLSSVLVTNRQNGEPDINKKFYIYEAERNWENSKIQYKLKGLYKTSSTGILNYSNKVDNYGELYMKGENEEVYHRLNPGYSYAYKPDSKWHDEDLIFTDRSIYRPGQTMFFKIISYAQKDRESRLHTHKKIKVFLRDANSQEIATLDLETNDYGSAAGEFELPISGLTGSYSIHTSDGQATFRVEEYKRPKFEVKVDTLKTAYQLNDQIKVSGTAVSFSGIGIDQAIVKYRIVREAKNWFLSWWRRDFSHGQIEEIKQGETKTNTNGTFSFDFIALPGNEEKGERIYEYQVYVDITDINGETQTARQLYYIGDHSMWLSFKFPHDQTTIEIDSLDKIIINTQNLDGNFIPAQGKYSLSKIKPNTRILRPSSLGQNVEYLLIPEKDLIEKLPHQPMPKDFSNDKPVTDPPLFVKSFNTGIEKTLQIPVNITPGKYLLEAYTVEKGDTIKTESVINIVDPQKIDVEPNVYFQLIEGEKMIAEGGKSKIIFISQTPHSQVLVEVMRRGLVESQKWLPIKNGKAEIDFVLDATDSEGVLVKYFFSYYNQAVVGRTETYLKPTQEEIEIAVKTFRDKLEPGKEETWELVIKDSHKNPMVVELLASMYDASLDKFVSHRWPYRTAFSQKSYERQASTGWFVPRFDINHIAKQSAYVYQSVEMPVQMNLLLFGLNFNRPEDGQRSFISILDYAQNGKVQKNWRDKIQDFNLYNFFVAWSYYGYDDDDYGDLRLFKSEAVAQVVPAPSAMGNEYKTREKDKAVAVVESAEDSSPVNTGQDEPGEISVRKNLQETAFFFPSLLTNEKGETRIRFTTPEALTQWRFMVFAHDKKLNTAYYEHKVQTQKEIMVVPNAPRFLREGDTVVISTKIASLGKEIIQGKAQLLLFDPITMKPIDGDFSHAKSEIDFSVSAENSAQVSWEIIVPTKYSAVLYRVVAQSGNYSDGEENVLPILSNRMLVTETMPFQVRKGDEKEFTLEKLKKNQSPSLQNFSLTLEVTENPVWYAIMALPYLDEFPFECSEQLFARYYANAIGTKLIEKSPSIKSVFDEWQNSGELLSPLEKNEELKSLLIQETPWVRDAQTEEEQMKRISLMFKLNKMQRQLDHTLRKLEMQQMTSGAFPWFSSGQENIYITTYIISGLGHLKNLGIDNTKADKIIEKALAYLDREVEKDYEYYKKNKGWKIFTPDMQIQYLYARSYYLEDYPLDGNVKSIVDEWLVEQDKKKLYTNMQTQVKLAMVFYRFKNKNAAEKLLTSLKEYSVESQEFGMYWKENQPGWHWYNAPIETQAYTIEAFSEVFPDDFSSIDEMKIWLLKNKQTHHWPTTKSTSLAIYALMNSGSDWINTGGSELEITWGGEVQKPSQKQKGSGYYKIKKDTQEIQSIHATIAASKKSEGISWGALYWQYFEDLDKITFAKTGIIIEKELYIKTYTPAGSRLEKITSERPVKIGDLVVVRLKIKTDRDMEFVHIKDMRAAGFEPVNVLSQYKWQDGFGYYESTKDASTNFFVDYMPKGSYVFEYELRASNAGDMSNGISSMQNMYAPELSTHTSGRRVKIIN